MWKLDDLGARGSNEKLPQIKIELDGEQLPFENAILTNCSGELFPIAETVIKEEPESEDDSIDATDNLDVDRLENATPGASLSCQTKVQQDVTQSVKKPFVCSTCRERFSTMSELRVHLSSHREAVLHLCKTCDQRFSLKSSLDEHLRTHIIPKPHKSNRKRKNKLGKVSSHADSFKEPQIIKTETPEELRQGNERIVDCFSEPQKIKTEAIEENIAEEPKKIKSEVKEESELDVCIEPIKFNPALLKVEHPVCNEGIMDCCQDSLLIEGKLIQDEPQIKAESIVDCYAGPSGEKSTNDSVNSSEESVLDCFIQQPELQPDHSFSNRSLPLKGSQPLNEQTSLIMKQFMDFASKGSKKELLCSICKMCFANRRNLIIHAQSHLPGQPLVWKCKKCYRSFPTIFTMERHLRSHLMDDSCEICGKSYSRKSKLTAHVWSHSTEKPYKCRYCDKGYLENRRLKNHMCRSHKDELSDNEIEAMLPSQHRYECDNCKKSYTKKSQLRKHIILKHGEKSFQCGVCQKCYATNKILEIHMRNHTGEKPYTCDKCSRSFTTNQYLRRHLATHR